MHKYHEGDEEDLEEDEVFAAWLAYEIKSSTKLVRKVIVNISSKSRSIV
jgi:hypothetical protein